MPPKLDPDTTPGVKTLRLFRKLLLDRRRHYQTDLAVELQCSPQTVGRLANEIETVIGTALHSGLDKRKRWYQYIVNDGRSLGLDYEELRFLSICREMASGILPDPVLKRVDASLRHLALHMADPNNISPQKHFSFNAKGRIDYTPQAEHIEKLITAADKGLCCEVTYRAPGREKPKEHLFVPARMVAMNNALYVVGFIVDADTCTPERPCNMAIHRVHHLTTTGMRIRQPLPQIDEAGFGLPWHEPRTFCIRFSPKVADYVREREWAADQRIEIMDDGSIKLTLTTCAEPELKAWVRGFGEDAAFASGY